MGIRILLFSGAPAFEKGFRADRRWLYHTPRWLIMVAVPAGPQRSGETLAASGLESARDLSAVRWTNLTGSSGRYVNAF